MRHQDQQPIHFLNLDMNFLDMKKKLIRNASQKSVPSGQCPGLYVRPWFKKGWKWTMDLSILQ